MILRRNDVFPLRFMDIRSIGYYRLSVILSKIVGYFLLENFGYLKDYL